MIIELFFNIWWLIIDCMPTPHRACHERAAPPRNVVVANVKCARPFISCAHVRVGRGEAASHPLDLSAVAVSGRRGFGTKKFQRQQKKKKKKKKRKTEKKRKINRRRST